MRSGDSRLSATELTKDSSVPIRARTVNQNAGSDVPNTVGKSKFRIFTDHSRSNASLDSPEIRLITTSVRTTGRRRATASPCLNVSAICRKVSRSSGGVRWKFCSRMKTARVRASRIIPAPDSVIGSGRLIRPSAPAVTVPAIFAARLICWLRTNTVAARSVPISSVIQAWSAPEVKV